MLNLRKITAILVGKIAINASIIAGRQGTNLPGRLSALIYPDLLSDLSSNVARDILVVTGTNGKTTTTNMTAAIMRQAGHSVIHNQAGANMMAGITTAFIQQTSWQGRRKFDYALLEADEANVPLLLQCIKPRFLLITNLFRDQLDRYGELDNIINMLIEAVKSKNIELVLNADDPLLSQFPAATGLKCWYYGFDDTVYDQLESSDSREGRFCVVCGNELDYTRYHYAQLGDYHCPKCQNVNPQEDFTGRDLSMTPQIRFKVNDMALVSPYIGLYNAYNVLAAVALAKLTGLPTADIQKGIADFKPAAGRMEVFHIDGREVVLILVKNPTGLNQSLTVMAQDNNAMNVFAALNDNAADGKDISWIWDADMEELQRAQDKIKLVVCSGLRSGDMAVRMKYAGIEAGKIVNEPELRAGIKQTLAGPGLVSYVLCTYTALFECRKILVKMQRS